MPTVNFYLDYLNKLAKRNLSHKEVMEFTENYGLEAKLSSGKLELEVTSERPDLLSPEGFTRVMNQYLFGKKVGIPKRFPINKNLYVDKSVADFRPYIGAVVLRNVNFSQEGLEEFFRFQQKISDTFGRNRRKAAIGAYDLSKIQGNINYLLDEKSKLSFVPLEETKPMSLKEVLENTQKGIQYGAIFGQMDFVPVLKDQSGKILSVPPIINADETKLTTKTRDVFIDVTGTSKDSVDNLLSIVSLNFLETGAKIEGVRINYPDKEIVTPNLNSRIFPIQLEKVSKILGKKYCFSQAKMLLNRMGLKMQKNGLVSIPRYRTDILDDSDFSGEIIIAEGLRNILEDKEFVRKEIGKPSKIKELEEKLSDISSRMSFQGVSNLVLTNPEYLELFSSDYVLTSNAKSKSYSACRTNTQISLIETLANNLNKTRPLNLYEIGDVIKMNKDGSIYETKSFGFASLGAKSSFSSAKSYMQTVLSQLKTNYNLEECTLERYIPGRAARIISEGESIGHFGEIHPKILNKYSIPEPISSGELDLKKIK